MSLVRPSVTSRERMDDDDLIEPINSQKSINKKQAVTHIRNLTITPDYRKIPTYS